MSVPLRLSNHAISSNAVKRTTSLPSLAFYATFLSLSYTVVPENLT